MLSGALALRSPYKYRPLPNLVKRMQLVWLLLLLAYSHGQSVLLSKVLQSPVALLLQGASASCLAARVPR